MTTPVTEYIKKRFPVVVWPSSKPRSFLDLPANVRKLVYEHYINQSGEPFEVQADFSTFFESTMTEPKLSGHQLVHAGGNIANEFMDKLEEMQTPIMYTLKIGPLPFRAYPHFRRFGRVGRGQRGLVIDSIYCHPTSTVLLDLSLTSYYGNYYNDEQSASSLTPDTDDKEFETLFLSYAKLISTILEFLKENICGIRQLHIRMTSPQIIAFDLVSAELRERLSTNVFDFIDTVDVISVTLDADRMEFIKSSLATTN